MPQFNKNRRRNRIVNPQFTVSDVLEARVLLSASNSEDNDREDDNDTMSDQDGYDDNGVSHSDDNLENQSSACQSTSIAKRRWASPLTPWRGLRVDLKSSRLQCRAAPLSLRE